MPWGKSWEMKTSGKSLLMPVKSPAVPVPDLADFLAQTPSLSCLPQKMRELARKSQRLLLRPDMACPLSKMTSQPSVQRKGPSEGLAVCFTARAVRGAVSPTYRQGEQHGEAQRCRDPPPAGTGQACHADVYSWHLSPGPHGSSWGLHSPQDMGWDARGPLRGPGKARINTMHFVANQLYSKIWGAKCVCFKKSDILLSTM